MTVHELKTMTEYFAAILDGRKTFELRKDDRGFKVDARFMALGGEPMDGPRHIWWNFASSRQDRIEQAKSDWKMARFDAVPGDNEFIPLPESVA